MSTLEEVDDETNNRNDGSMTVISENELEKPNLEGQNTNDQLDDKSNVEKDRNTSRRNTTTTTATTTTTTNNSNNNNNDEEANIQKTIRFWNHPSLRDVPANEKREYLHERGVTDDQISKAWERIVESDNTDTFAANSLFSSSNKQPPQQFASASNTQAQQQIPYSSNEYPHRNQQQHYQHNQYPPSSTQYSQFDGGYHHHYPDEDDGVLSLVQGTSLVTLGGMIGLTAAAAVRWLNGGDFTLFPPPQIHDHSSSADPNNDALGFVSKKLNDAEYRGSTVEEGRVENNAHHKEEKIMNDIQYDKFDLEEENLQTDVEYDDDEELDDDDDEILVEEEPTIVEEKALGLLQSLSDTMKEHVNVQEKLLQRLTSSNRSITDQSMNLLRSADKQSNNNGNNANAVEKQEKIEKDNLALWSKLVEIKGEIACLHASAIAHTGSVSSAPSQISPRMGAEWEKHVQNTMYQLDHCINTLNDSIRIQKGAEESKTTATKTTTQEKFAVITTPILDPTSSSNASMKQSTPPSAVTWAPDSSCRLPKGHSSLLRQSVKKLVEENESATLIAGSQLLYLYISNLCGQPENPRYRKIYTCNESFQRVENLTGGKEFLFAIGFQEQEGYFEWQPMKTGESDNNNNNNNNNSRSNQQQETEGNTHHQLLKDAVEVLKILKSSKHSATRSKASLIESVLSVSSPDPDKIACQQVTSAPSTQISIPSSVPLQDLSSFNPTHAVDSLLTTNSRQTQSLPEANTAEEKDIKLPSENSTNP